LLRSVAHALLVLLLATSLAACFAREAPCEDDVDDILGGFDDEPGESFEGSVEEGEMDDILGGFEDELGEGKPPSMTEGAEERFWDLTGSVSLGGSVNYLKHHAVAGTGRRTDYGGLQRLRTRLNLELDVDLPRDWKGRLAGFGFFDWAYLANGRGNYTKDVRDLYEWEVDFQEVWVQGSLLDDLDLKVGRQIVNWGRSDTLRVLDVLNPLDNREPALVDIEDLRRPVTMVKADYYFGSWGLSAIAIPEIRFSLNPPFGSDFAPVLSSVGTVEAYVFPEDKPKESFDNTQWAAALTGIFSGWDVSFHFARMFQDLEYLDPKIGLAAVGPIPISFEGTKLRHSRTTLVGAGANYTIGSWLFKAEIAWTDGIDYTTSTSFDLSALGLGIVAIPTGTVRRSRLDFMGGIEYYGWTDTNIALEVVNRHIFGFRNDMRPLFGTQENTLETALRITRTFMNDRLEVTALGVVFGSYAQDGSVVRLEAHYDLRDALELVGGIVFYQKGDPPPFDIIKNNDRLFFEVKYSF
jgi:hypothetical protein